MDIVEQLRNHALPDPCDEREVMHAPLLRQAADEIERLRAEVQHWKANHDNRVEAVRVLIERNDLPFDRVPAYKHYLHLQEDVAALRAENESLRKDRDRLNWVLDSCDVLWNSQTHSHLPEMSRSAIDAAIREQGTAT